MSSYYIRRERSIPIPQIEGLDIEGAIGGAANEFLAFLVERAQLNAPIKKNILRPSIYFKPSSENYRGAWSLNLYAAVAYASFMHENTYQLGPRSAMQPGTVEGGVGNKFLSRVAEYWLREQKFQRLVMDRISEQVVRFGFRRG